MKALEIVRKSVSLVPVETEHYLRVSVRAKNRQGGSPKA